MPQRRRDPEPKPPRTARLLPLDYLLQALNDPASSRQRKDWAAKAALPFCHSRLADTRPSKKAQREAGAAKKAGGRGTAWGDDLDADGHQRQ